MTLHESADLEGSTLTWTGQGPFLSFLGWATVTASIATGLAAAVASLNFLFVAYTSGWGAQAALWTAAVAFLGGLGATLGLMLAQRGKSKTERTIRIDGRGVHTGGQTYGWAAVGDLEIVQGPRRHWPFGDEPGLSPTLRKLLGEPHLYQVRSWIRGRSRLLARDLTETEAESVARVIEEFRPVPGVRDRTAERELRSLRGQASRDVLHSRS